MAGFFSSGLENDWTMHGFSHGSCRFTTITIYVIRVMGTGASVVQYISHNILCVRMYGYTVDEHIV